MVRNGSTGILCADGMHRIRELNAPISLRFSLNSICNHISVNTFHLDYENVYSNDLK